MRSAEFAEEHLRRALLDLQEANRAFALGYADPSRAEEAAKRADEARTQAARWALLAREVDSFGED